MLAVEIIFSCNVRLGTVGSGLFMYLISMSGRLDGTCKTSMIDDSRALPSESPLLTIHSAYTISCFLEGKKDFTVDIVNRY
jgi:hypothetical protein